MNTRAINAWRMKVGGIHFVRIGRLQISFCVCKSYKPKKDKHTVIISGETEYQPRARSAVIGSQRVLLPSF